MAYKTTALLGLDTSLVNIFPDMALGAVVHFHPLPWLVAKTGNVFPPDIAAVAGDAVFLINPGVFGFTNMTVALGALHLTGNHMGGMGEINAVRLARVNQPGHFPFGHHIFCYEFLLLFTGADDVFMALHAAFEVRNTGKASVFPEIVIPSALLSRR